MSTLSSSVNTLQLFAEPTRVRLMALLEEEELTVAELVNITELAQSSVSTHLGKLRDAGFLRDRRVGASTLYSLNDGNMPAGAKQVWSLVRGELKDAVLDGDRGRCAAVLEARQRTNAWPDAVAGQMERHYSPATPRLHVDHHRRFCLAVCRHAVCSLRWYTSISVGHGRPPRAETHH